MKTVFKSLIVMLFLPVLCLYSIADLPVHAGYPIYAKACILIEAANPPLQAHEIIE